MEIKQVLVVSYQDDGTAELLVKRLKEIGQAHTLVDLGKFPKCAKATIDYSGDDGRVQILFRGQSYSFSSESVKSIWWRRPKGKVRTPSADPIEKYIELESEIFVSSLFSFFKSVRWVSDPEKTRVANLKPLQLQVARSVGLRVPKTLISNDPQQVEIFLRSNWDLPVVMKPVGTAFVRISEDTADPENQNLVIYTKIVDKNLVLGNLKMVANCPVIFQEAAEQEFDVRVTVIGESVFAARVGHSEDLGAGESNVDWRHHKLKRTFEKHELPVDTSEACVKLTKQLGLNFGAIDLGYSKKRGYVFFEINPQGQWVPSETIAGYPISQTLARFLSDC